MGTAREEILQYAVKLLSVRDYTIKELHQRLTSKFGEIPDDAIRTLIAKRFLNDRRYAENYIAKRKARGAVRLRDELVAKGIDPDLADEMLGLTDWPSLHEALAAKMVDWNLRAPLQPRDAARLFRALARLGYEEDAIREVIAQLHEQ